MYLIILDLDQISKNHNVEGGSLDNPEVLALAKLWVWAYYFVSNWGWPKVSLCLSNVKKLRIHSNTHCFISLLIPFEEDVCTFLIFSYSFIGQQLLLKQFFSNRLSFWDSLLTSTANPASMGRTGCAVYLRKTNNLCKTVLVKVVGLWMNKKISKMYKHLL